MNAESTKDLSGQMVTVVDPGSPTPRSARILQTGAHWSLQELTEDQGQGPSPVDRDLHISPGWVDLHTHVYDGMTQISVHPDRVGIDQGVHLLADAGSAGAATISGLAKYVLPSVRTKVLAWINIGSHGLVHLREVADPTFIDVDATIAAVEAHRNLIRGIKVRSSGAIVGAMGIQPLQLAKFVARATETPLMVHIGEAPPMIEDILDMLDQGDVVTHCFHGKAGRPWDNTGRPVPALLRALDRGVILDVGHGAASFDIEVARTATTLGIRPTTRPRRHRRVEGGRPVQVAPPCVPTTTVPVTVTVLGSSERVATLTRADPTAAASAGSRRSGPPPCTDPTAPAHRP